jgi:hypothetical protein
VSQLTPFPNAIFAPIDDDPHQLDHPQVPMGMTDLELLSATHANNDRWIIDLQLIDCTELFLVIHNREPIKPKHLSPLSVARSQEKRSRINASRIRRNAIQIRCKLVKNETGAVHPQVLLVLSLRMLFISVARQLLVLIL